MNKWLRRGLLGAGVVAVVALASIVAFLPAAAAYACPWCYGLREVAPGVYLETGTPREARARFLQALRTAQARVSIYYPERVAERTVVLACSTRACDRRLGGKGAKARAFGATFIHISPGGWNVDILSHELAHIELHARAGMSALMSGALPAWFDEGLAVIVSQDARYVNVDEDGNVVCKVSGDGALPETRQDWGREAGQGLRPIYAMAACRVLAWLDRHGGASAVHALGEALERGEAFRE